MSKLSSVKEELQSAMLKIFQVDAFTQTLFGGNPAAVVVLEHWINDTILQSIAAENNLAETAYVVPAQEGWELRWFTPSIEVALCGHATLAAAYVLVTHLGCADDVLKFATRQSGTLSVEKNPDGALAMSFPSIPVTPSSSDDSQTVGVVLGKQPTSVWQGNYSEDQFDFVAVYESADEVAALRPDLPSFKKLTSRGVIATAKGDNCDFVSRYFAPNIGINEDPVTGSAHCLLTPYWSHVLEKTVLDARQISARGGKLHCALDEDRTVLTGYAVSYLEGCINI